MQQWGIRNKVLMVTLAPTILITLLLGVFFAKSWLGNITDLLRERGESLSRQLAIASEYGLFTANRNLLFGVASSMLEERDVRSVTLLDKAGNVLLHTGPRTAMAVDAAMRNTHQTVSQLSADTSLYVSPVYLQDLMLDSLMLELDTRPDTKTNDAPIGWAAVELTHASTDKERYKALFFSLLMVTGGILANLAIAWRMSRTVTDPIFRLTDAVTHLKEGKLDTRIALHAGPEIDQLASGLNAMAAGLNKAYAEMQQNIDQATEDLRETLETIEIQNIDLDQARKQAIDASRIKSEFLANMSHEIRTPLNGIIGFTDLLLKSPMSQQQKDHLSTIRKSSEILLTIINDILDFSKIEAGKLVLDRIPFKLRDIIEEVMAMLAPSAHAKHLDLAALVYSDVPDNIVGDPLRIKQIITNLINNAIKFTQTGEVVLRAMIEEDGDKHTLIRISVTDSGVGLSRAQQQSLFTAFGQADASTARQYGGTGLGLVISKRLVEEMGGQIGLQSDLGKGSTFWFTLKTQITHAIEPSASREGLANERVIYLEQQKTTGMAITHLLNDWGLEVVRVNTPSEMIATVIEAQSRQRGFAVALLGLSSHMLQSHQYRDLLTQLEMDLDCRCLLMTPTLTEQESALIHMASIHHAKPIRRERFFNDLFTLIHGVAPSLPDASSATGIDPKALSAIAPRVLAVDDNDANLKLAVTLLRDLGLTTDGANSGFEAVSKARQFAYDLIFMDVQMPGMDGVETTQRIRSLDSRNANIPIVALTAHALNEERDRLLRSGLDDYLTKPISLQQLIDVVRRQTGFDINPPNQNNPRMPPADAANAQPLRPSSRHRPENSVDINACIRLAANKADLAEELFSMLIEQLRTDHPAIQQLFAAQQLDSLLERVHKLHGATRYCGVPELSILTEKLETALKRKSGPTDALVKDLLEAIERIQQWSEHTDWQTLFRQAQTG